MNELTQMPVAGLDGLSREDLERELRGAIYVAQARVRDNGSKENRDHLARLYRRARSEQVQPWYHGRKEAT